MLFLLDAAMPNDTIKYLQSINDNFETIKNIVDVSNDTISNELSAVNTLLVVFSIILALVGVGLGIYIAVLHHKVIKIKESIDEKEQTVLRLANTVAETDKKITSNLSSLYKQLQHEESLSLLRRLEEEPQDITNLSNLLLARPLGGEGFSILKQAFMKLKSRGPEIDVDGFLYPSYSKQYSLQFFQHYLRESLLDDDLRPDIVKYFERNIECAFERDIIKSTKDFCQALSVSDSSFDKVALLVDYLKALNQSDYCNLQELKKIFRENLNEELLVEAIDKCTNDKCYLSMFGVYPPADSEDKNNSDSKEDE